MVQAEKVDSDEEPANIARTEEALDECYQRRAKRAGVTMEGLEGRPISEEERDRLSERLGNGEGVRAKRRKEIEEMQLETIEAEVEEIEKTLARRRGITRPRGLGSLPLTLTIVCLMGGPASAFTAYDCSNRSNVIELYSLLEPDTCVNTGKEGGEETTVYGEIIQIKQDRMIPVFRCLVIETIISQYCGHCPQQASRGTSASESPKHWKPGSAAKQGKMGRSSLTGARCRQRYGPHAMFLSGAMDDDSNCEIGIISFPNGKTLGGQTAQSLYEVTLREEFSRLNELTGGLTLTSGYRHVLATRV
jgi:hypothetical protein